MNIDKEEIRQAFESWVSANYKLPIAIECNAEGHYTLATTSLQWITWQAAYQSLGDPVALHVTKDNRAIPVYRLPEQDK